MAITRRDFLKYSAVVSGSLMLGVFDLKPVKAYAEANPPVWTTETPNICPYCGVGCGMIIGRNDLGQIAHVEGDPANPNNNGKLCSKGQNAGQMNHIEGYAGTAFYKAPDSERVITPLRRSAGSNTWTAISWDTAMSEIAGLINSTRTVDADYKCTNIAVLGTAKATNEECYLLTKLMRSLGIVYYEHCARL